ncbi:MAG TPA: hypothetical protein DHN33_06540 [Eubacteriaceae bacterium]|nr:hypothetical protein [Eubacteriaceae bacterium]
MCVNQYRFIKLQKEVVPELTELLELRYGILSYLKEAQPVGRRQLAQNLKESERHVRNEVEFFQRKGWVEVQRQGILLTEQGEHLLRELKEVVSIYKGMDSLESKLLKVLGIKKVIIVPGNQKNREAVLSDIGQKAAQYILDHLQTHSVVGVTGGSTVSAVAAQMPRAGYPGVTVLPARGGIGKSHSNQANSIVSRLAEQLGASKEMLHLPDSIDAKLLEALKSDPDINAVFQRLKEMDMMVFGIGRADVMAKARNLSQEKISELERKKAVAEAFGYFFDEKGEVVFRSSSVGIKVEDYKKIKHPIAVAGGAEKARAILATTRVNDNMVLITDENAAKEILNIKEDILRRNF